MVCLETWKSWEQRIRTFRPKSTANHFCSLPYLIVSEAEVCSDGDWLWIEADGLCLFPPAPLRLPEEGESAPKSIDFVWSDLGNMEPLQGFSAEFLDNEFIYDPKNMADLSGKKWTIFRKNVRKWPRRNPDHRFLVSYSPPHDDDSIRSLVIEWAESKEEEVEDLDILIKFALRPPPGVGHYYLLDRDGKLASLSIWDWSWSFLNYRFLLVRKREEDSFLDEFSRWSFYGWVANSFPGVLVNDGGNLGKAGLEAFKDRLHPLRKRKVYSWKKGDLR